MKPDTEQIIEALRAGAWAAEIKLMDIAADRLEELQKERDNAHAEVKQLKAEVNMALAAEERAKKSRDEAWCRAREAEAEAPTVNQLERTRPEPSRLEIAAMLKAGWFANRDADFNATDHKWWIEQADALIAAAKEAK
jgi:Skp family chaperone for outer membrane proteins